MNKPDVRTGNKRIGHGVEALYSTTAHWIVIAFGIVIRITQFFYNRSLTEGEAALALNIVERSYLNLLKPLDYFQAAPVGFLFIERCAVNVLGTSEYALRLFPLIAGIVAFFLFYHCAKSILKTKAIPVALILFAVGDHLIYFSSEVKQYSSDALCAVLVLTLLVALQKNRHALYYLAYGLVAAVAIWFSHPALFIFTAGGVVLLIEVIHHKKWSTLVFFCCGAIIAVISFGANYMLSLAPLTRTTVLVDTWYKSFAPFPIASLQDAYWYLYVFLRMFVFPVGLSHYELLLGVIAFACGIISLHRGNQNISIMFMLSILITLFASALHLYPFEGRLLLFLTPTIVLLIAQGVASIQSKLSTSSPLISTIFIVLLLAHPVMRAGYHVVKPRAPEELRTVLTYVDENYRDGDVIYVYYASLNAYRYYAYRYEFSHEYVIGIESRNDWKQYYYDLATMKGRNRVWVLVSHIATWHGVDEEKLFVSYLGMLGKQKDVLRVSGAAAYLYDLSD